MTDFTCIPREAGEDWFDQHWSCQIDPGGYGDPRTASYYSFLRPTHTIYFLNPYGDLSQIHVVQTSPAPDQRPSMFRLPDPLPVGWIHPDDPKAVKLPRRSSQWKATR